MAGYTRWDRRTVYLDDLDGFQFEKLCVEIFRQLGARNIVDVRNTADEGRDIVLELPTSAGPVRTVVECKHHLKKVIGRPVVQKLHSAVVTDGAKKGILITTGYFSQGAIEYARKIRDVEIELIDLDRLRILGERAGFEILLDASEAPIRSFEISDPSTLLTSLNTKVLHKIHSYPRKLSDIAPLVDCELELTPAYLGVYSIHVDFVSPSGICVGYRVHVDDAPFFLDGVSGEPMPKEVFDFFRDRRPTMEAEEVKELPCRISWKHFNIGERDAKHRIVKSIIGLYTKRVFYTGRNNRLYSMLCEPSPQDVLLLDFKKVYLPRWRFEFRSSQHRYVVEFMERDGGETLLIFSNDFDFCSICKQKIPPRRHGICDECGGVMHYGHLWKPHGHRCSRCGRLVCLNHVYFERRLVLFRRPVCPSCWEIRSHRKGSQRVQARRGRGAQYPDTVP